MNKDLLWKQFLEKVQSKVNSLVYSTWFENSYLLDITETKATIVLPSIIHKQRIESTYQDIIIQTLTDITGNIYDLDFMLEDEVSKIEEKQTIETEQPQIKENKKFRHESNLKPQCTFDTFVVGNSNRLAHAAAFAVAESPGLAYNPLFLYGNSGLGKTHLMHAIGNYIEANSNKRVLYVTSEQFISDFSILDDVKRLFNTSRVIRVTLSIGITCSDVNVNDLSEDAQNQLELALSRGGDQVVVKKNSEVLFFGAKTDPITKASKVEIRVKSEELINLMTNSSKVFVLGHKMIDADGFAATIAIYRCAKKLGKTAYIIYDPESIDNTVAKIFKTIKEEYVSFLEAFVTPNKLPKLVDKDSLLMVVDFQTTYQAIDNHIFNHFEKIGIIDHHRKGSGAIENPKFYYSQASASSSVELIFELMSFMKEPVEFSELEATWMLLGMVVDTNNFVYRASSTTFEVASTLKKYGADMNIVKEYLKEDLSEKIARQDAITNTEIYRGKFAIGYTSEDQIFDRAFLAKVSDELISISDIELAVTVGRISENQIGLSARSLGKINSQIIMEKMGGGGHLNNAAAQIKNGTVAETIALLKEKLDSYLAEEENMKIILTKDLKGKGKKGDIIEVAAGYGNNLIRNENAIIASPENLKMLAEEKNQEQIREAELLQEMKDLKDKLEATEIKILVKVGKEGKLFGSVSSKQIADAIFSQLNVKIDKRKLDMDNTINALGSYEIPIQLHKDVIAKIKVFVVEG